MATEHWIETKDARLLVRDHGAGPTLVFAHSLGLNCRIWDDVIARFPDHRCIAYDLRGHGQSDVPPGPYSMGAMVTDAETICDALDLKDVVFVGLSIGGMIAQGLAVKRLDLVRAMVIISTGAKLGQPDPWHARAKAARELGMSAVVDDHMTRWNVTTDAARAMLLAAPPEGYAATCEAIAGTDFYTPTSGLRLPTLGLSGDKDKATPPDLVRETTDLIPGSDFQLIKGAGHISPVTHSADLAAKLHAFLNGIAHA